MYEAKDRSFDVRAKVKEALDPWSVYARLQQDSKLAMRIGRAVGGILAEQHTRIVLQDVDPWLPRQVRWPEPSEWIRERVPHVVMDSGLLRDIDKVLVMHDGLVVGERDRVLAHTDVGFHNLAFEPETRKSVVSSTTTRPPGSTDITTSVTWSSISIDGRCWRRPSLSMRLPSD